MRGTLTHTLYYEYDPQPLVQARNERSLSQRQAAEEASISFVSLSRLESGLYRPTYEFLKELCDFYGIPIETVVNASPLKIKYTHPTKRLTRKLA